MYATSLPAFCRRRQCFGRIDHQERTRYLAWTPSQPLSSARRRCVLSPSLRPTAMFSGGELTIFAVGRAQLYGLKFTEILEWCVCQSSKDPGLPVLAPLKLAYANFLADLGFVSEAEAY